MKKNPWFVFVALSMMAIFLVVGCKPTTPQPTSTPETSPELTSEPDTECPEVLKTVVYDVYDLYYPGSFRVVITFDEDLESGCIENPEKWDLEVKLNNGTVFTTEKGDILVYQVTAESQKVTVKARFTGGNEVFSGRYTWNLHDCSVADDLGNFCCHLSDSVCYAPPTCEECVEECPLGGGICP